MARDPYFELVPEPQQPTFDPARTALLMIDLQYGDAHPDGWMGKLCRAHGRPHLLDERWAFVAEVLPSVRRLQDACRAGGVELIHIRVKFLTRDGRDGVPSFSLGNETVLPDARDDDFLELVAPGCRRARSCATWWGRVAPASSRTTPPTSPWSAGRWSGASPRRTARRRRWPR
jgi:nicotinamidase-related amidase